MDNIIVLFVDFVQRGDPQLLCLCRIVFEKVTWNMDSTDEMSMVLYVLSVGVKEFERVEFIF